MCGAIDILLLAIIVYNLSSFFFLVQSNIIRNRIGFNSHPLGGQNREQSFFLLAIASIKRNKSFSMYFFLFLGTEILHYVSLSKDKSCNENNNSKNDEDTHSLS